MQSFAIKCFGFQLPYKIEEHEKMLEYKRAAGLDYEDVGTLKLKRKKIAKTWKGKGYKHISKAYLLPGNQVLAIFKKI